MVYCNECDGLIEFKIELEHGLCIDCIKKKDEEEEGGLCD